MFNIKKFILLFAKLLYTLTKVILFSLFKFSFVILLYLVLSLALIFKIIDVKTYSFCVILIQGFSIVHKALDLYNNNV